jgi:ATP-binding cassette subfamily F protein 3
MITVQNLTKHYGMQTLFEGLSFTVNPRERIGLVGRNGHGKTTILRMLTGQERPDDGEILIPKNYRIGYLKQELDFTKPTVIEEACTTLPEGGVGDQWKAEKILMGLGFDEEDFERPISHFSGGFQVRLCLAKVLLSEPDMLLLDEPTNFLDIVSVRWLIKFLRAWRGELILITHDRGFMDSVVSHIMGIHRMKVRKMKGLTEEYYSQIEQEEIVHEKRRVTDEKRRKEIEEYIDSFRAKARHAKSVQSHVKMLDRMEKIEKLDNIKSLSFTFDYRRFEPHCVMETRDLSFAYTGEGPFLIKDLNLKVERNDKIGIIGKNGKGKTTLVKLLTGRLKPLSGEVKLHPSAEIAYYEQANTAELKREKTVEEEILSVSPAGNIQRARDIAGIMMFSGDAALKKISVLSGGERCRVLLGKIIMAPTNTLVFDEPTHHMDMYSCEAMMDAVGNFPGAALIVTHDERFLHRVATKLVVFKNNKVFVFPGPYSEFLDRIGWDDEGVPTVKADGSVESQKKQEKEERKEERRQRAEEVTERAKILRPYEIKIKEIEAELADLEEKQKKENERLVKASARKDARKIAELSQSTHGRKRKIEDLYLQLDRVFNEYEARKKKMENKE